MDAESNNCWKDDEQSASFGFDMPQETLGIWSLAIGDRSLRLRPIIQTLCRHPGFLRHPDVPYL